MDRSIRMGPRYHGLLFALVLAGALAGSAGCDPFARTCDTDADCEGNARCVASYCTTQCVYDSDCRSKTDACTQGHCQPVSDPSCSTDEECIQPGPCQLGTGALCVAGACVYQPRPAGGPCDDGNRCTTADLCNGMGACVGAAKPCTKQPASECIGNDDDIFVTYSTIGVCDAESGECTYTRTEQPCPQCSTDCLVMCLGRSCPDTAGGCLVAGRCVPTWPEARCEHDFAPTGTHCSLSAQSAALLGFCSQGICFECLADADCDTPPGHPACFTATCASGGCTYTPVPDRLCEVEHCTGGVVYFERSCDAVGQCPAPIPELFSCAGYACDAAGSGCRTTCSSTSECVSGLNCRIDHTCEPPRANGESCTENGQCASAHCQCADARCEAQKCAPSACPCGYDADSDGVCDGFIEDGRDDASNTCGALSCNGQGRCNLANGAPCTNAVHCESNFCADGVCCIEACEGPCMACGSDGLCNVTPADDAQCGTIDCDGLDRACRDYADITTGRCEGFGDCKDPNTTDCTVYTDAASGSEGNGAGCPTCQDCNGAGDCAPVASGQQDAGCDGGTATCSNADACDGAGQCQFNHLAAGSEGNGAGCPTCQDCNGAGACANVGSGQQDVGCTTGATTCSNADTCNGAGQCVANDLPAGNEGNDGGCPTCQDCNGAGACAYVSNGQQDVGCNAGATACSGADTCNGAGQCLASHLPNGSDGGCPTCQDCNGAGACEYVPSGQQDTGCNGGVTTCSNADACNGAGQCQFNHLPAGSEGTGSGCPTCQDCNGSGACAAVNGAIDVGCDDDSLECSYQICQTGTCVYRDEPDGTFCRGLGMRAALPPCFGTCIGGVCEPDPSCCDPYCPPLP